MFAVDMFLTAGVFLLSRVIIHQDYIYSVAATRYILAFTVFLVFFFTMYDLYKTKTDDAFSAMVATAFSVMFSGVCTFFTAFTLRWRMFSIRVWFIEIGMLFVSLVVWRTIAALFIKKYGPKKSV